MDNVSPQRRSEIMARVRAKNTIPEMLVRRLVFSEGYRYRLHDRSLPGTPDLVFRRTRKVIFVHGCFWHGHARCKRARMPTANSDYWYRKIERNRTRDRLTAAALRRGRWRVLTIWECQLRDLGKVERNLLGFLNA